MQIRCKLLRLLHGILMHAGMTEQGEKFNCFVLLEFGSIPKVKFSLWSHSSKLLQLLHGKVRRWIIGLYQKKKTNCQQRHSTLTKKYFELHNHSKVGLVSHPGPGCRHFHFTFYRKPLSFHSDEIEFLSFDGWMIIICILLQLKLWICRCFLLMTLSASAEVSFKCWNVAECWSVKSALLWKCTYLNMFDIPLYSVHLSKY